MKKELNLGIVPNGLTFGGNNGEFASIDGDNIGGSIITVYTKQEDHSPSPFINALQIGNRRYGGNGGSIPPDRGQGRIPQDGSILIHGIQSYSGEIFYIKLQLEGNNMLEAGDQAYQAAYARFEAASAYGFKTKLCGIQYSSGDNGRISQLLFVLAQ